jgi:hypothetical protein
MAIQMVKEISKCKKDFNPDLDRVIKCDIITRGLR